MTFPVVRLLSVLSSFCCLVWCLGLEMPVQAQKVKMQASPSQTTYTFHPIRLSPQHQSVILEVKGRGVYKENGHDRIPSVVATFYAVQGQKRHQLYTTDLAEYLFTFVDVSLYRHESSGHYLLAVEANGGRYDHTQVYLIDPTTLHLRPLFEDIGVIWGDPSELSRGRLVEHTYDQYVAEEEMPADFRRRDPHLSEHLSRVWTYVPSKKKFQPGRYQWNKPAIETELQKRDQTVAKTDSKLAGLVRQWYVLEQKENAALAEVQSHNRLPAQLYVLGKPGRMALLSLRPSHLLSSDENLAQFRWKAIVDLGDAGLAWIAKSLNKDEIVKEFRSLLSPDLRSQVSKRFLNRTFTGEAESIRLLLVQDEAVAYTHARRMMQGGTGKLGRVTVELASIYATPVSSGQVLTEAPRDTYLALMTKSGKFYGVRMADDSTGYIAMQDMELVNDTVVSAELEAWKGEDSRSKSSREPKVGAGNLASVQERVLKALRASDWKALLRDARSELAIVKYRRVYGAERDFLRGKRLASEGEGLEALDTSGEEDSVCVTTTLLVNTRKPLSRTQNAEFLAYCRKVQDTYRTDPQSVQRGAHLKAEDGFPLTGPAVQGKNNSATNWRVEFVFDGRWYVHRLISTLH